MVNVHKIMYVVLLLPLLNCSFSSGSHRTDQAENESNDGVKQHADSVVENLGSVVEKDIPVDKELDKEVAGEALAQKEQLLDDSSFSLKKAYKNYFPIGTAVLASDITNGDIASFIGNQYSSITPANDMKPTYLQAKENIFSWKGADLIVDFAVRNNMKVRGHTLIWPNFMPKWMFVDNGKRVSKELLLKRLKDHITTVVSRYKGKVYCWDVVNEAIQYFGPDPINGARKDDLYDILGEEYFIKAFEYAHEADPNAKLFYNDSAFEWKRKRERIYSVLKRLKENGVPIDGVGMQSHLGIEGIDAAYLQETIDMFARIGLEVQITEMDVRIFPQRIVGKYVTEAMVSKMSTAFDKSLEDEQAEVYKTIFKIARENKGKVTGVTMWAPYDRDNWLTRKYKRKCYPYLFNENKQPKRAFRSVVEF